MRRFGGWNPLKVLAVAAGVVIGGIVAAGVVNALVFALALIGVATVGFGGLLVYGWIIAAYLIYRAVRSRQADAPPDTIAPDQRQVEREYRQRAAQLQECADTTGTGQSTKRSRSAGFGTAAVAVVSGLLLALGANVGISGLNLPPLANTLLPPLTGAVAGVGVWAALRRWVMGPVDDEYPPAREIKGQIKRIRRKARDLRREAAEAGGVFNGLDAQADRLAAEAQELTDRLFELRAVARDVRGKMSDAARIGGPQERVHELLARNRATQRQCLVQIERIEDLLDVARLEIACPDEQMPPDRGREELVREVETELEAARRALEEVQRQSQTV